MDTTTTDRQGFPLFGVSLAAAASLSRAPTATVRTWIRNGELGRNGLEDPREGELSSHQVLVAAALSHFKDQKRNPVTGSMASHLMPLEPFVVMLNKDRIPLVVTVEDLPRYLLRPVAVVVFDARPVMEQLLRLRGGL